MLGLGCWLHVLLQCNATLTVVLLYLMAYLSDCLDNHSLQQPGRNTLHEQVFSCRPSHPSWSMSAAARLPVASRCLSSRRLIREHRGHAHYKPLKRHEDLCLEKVSSPVNMLKALHGFILQESTSLFDWEQFSYLPASPLISYLSHYKSKSRSVFGRAVDTRWYNMTAI